MSQIFQNYEAEFADLVSDLRALVSQVGGLSGQLRESKVAEVDKAAGEGEALLRRMELEARSIGGTQKSELLAKIKGNRAEIARLKASARDASRIADQRTAAAARAELGLDAAPAGASGSAQSQRDRMLSATETLQKSSDRIRQGQQSLLQTEELGANILQDLHRQRETINHTRETLKTTDENIGTARKVLKSLSRWIW